jgi:hypothetical protein
MIFALSECATICIETSDPVCGTDGRTYQNLCKLEVANCEDLEKDILKSYDGECDDDERR